MPSNVEGNNAPVLKELGGERPVQWSAEELPILMTEVDEYRDASKSERHVIWKRVLVGLLELAAEKREPSNKEKLKQVSIG